MWELDKESWALKIDAFELWCWRRLLRVPWTARRSNQSIPKDWCWSWNSSTLATWCEELTHLKTPWCWEGLGAGGEGDDRGWDGWMASPTQWTWVWVNSGSWWWTERPGVLQSMGSQKAGHDWATELNWTELIVVQLCKKKRLRITMPGLSHLYHHWSEFVLLALRFVPYDISPYRYWVKLFRFRVTRNSSCLCDYTTGKVHIYDHIFPFIFYSKELPF